VFFSVCLFVVLVIVSLFLSSAYSLVYDHSCAWGIMLRGKREMRNEEYEMLFLASLYYDLGHIYIYISAVFTGI